LDSFRAFLGATDGWQQGLASMLIIAINQQFDQSKSGTDSTTHLMFFFLKFKNRPINWSLSIHRISLTELVHGSIIWVWSPALAGQSLPIVAGPVRTS
jgi:hypothetical protein